MLTVPRIIGLKHAGAFSRLRRPFAAPKASSIGEKPPRRRRWCGRQRIQLRAVSGNAAHSKRAKGGTHGTDAKWPVPQLHRDPCYSGHALIDSAFRCAAYSLSPAPEGSAPLHDHKLREPYSGRRCAVPLSVLRCIIETNTSTTQSVELHPRQPRAFLSPRGAVRWQGSHRRRRTQRLYLHCPHLIRRVYAHNLRCCTMWRSQ